MDRRTFLGTLSGAVVLTTGCLSTDGSEGPSTAEPTDARTDTPTESPTATPPETGSPDGDDGTDTPFANVLCPSFADSADITVCSHTRALNPPVVLTASEQVFSPTTGDDTVERLQFVLENRSDSRFGMNPYAWAVKRRTSSGWTHVAPEAHIEPWLYVDGGDAFRWTLSVEEAEGPSDGDTVSAVTDLDSGTYAFQVTGVLGADGTATAASGTADATRVECIALFEVDRS